MDIIICESCTFENEYGKKYCQNCGHPLFYNNENNENIENEEELEFDEETINTYTDKILKDDTYFEKLNNIILTITNTLSGHEIEKYIDVITTESIVGIGIGTHLKSIGDFFADLTGSEYRAMTNRIEKVKINLKEKIKEEALKLEGDAVIGIDFESSSFMSGAIMVSASGTVVKLKKDNCN